MLYYWLFGLSVACSEPLSKLTGLTLPVLADDMATPDVLIEFVETLALEQLPAMTQIAAFCYASPDNFFLTLPDVGEFYVAGGNQIKVVKSSAADMDVIQLYLLGYIFAVLLHQRRQLVLHGNVLQRNGRAIVICGASGIGKSTLSAALLAQGFSLLSDDIVAFNAEGLIEPGSGHLQLWQDAVQTLLPDNPELNAVRTDMLKFYYPAVSDVSCNALAVKAVFILSDAHIESPELAEIAGMRKFMPIKQQTYKAFLLQPLGLLQTHLQLCSSRLGHLPLFDLRRQRGKLTETRLQALADVVTTHCREQGF